MLEEVKIFSKRFLLFVLEDIAQTMILQIVTSRINQIRKREINARAIRKAQVVD